MMVYVNGDSHSAGAEIANPYCFAEDDPLYWALGRKPHPDNIKLSYGCLIANELDAVLTCDAESASSNDRILRTTINTVSNKPVPDLVIIGWSTIEREEWCHNGAYYQVTASGRDSVPDELRQRYKEWVLDQNNVTREKKLLKWHNQIWNLHLLLKDQNIPHIFFNTYSDFEPIRTGQLVTTNNHISEYNWDHSYIEPYDSNYTYYNWLISKGFVPDPNSYHFGADAHYAWSVFLLQHYRKLLLTQNG